MGKKLMMLSMGFSAVAVVLSMICLLLPFHRMSYFFGGLVKGMVVTTYTIKISFDVKASDLCGAMGSDKEESFCDRVPKAKDLEDAQQRWCSDVPKRVFPNLCEGLRGAYYLGTAVVVLVVINAILCAIAGYLDYHYIHFAPKRSYRMTGMVLQVVGIALVMMVLLVYYPLVLMPLDSNRGRNGASLAISPSDTTGWGRGYQFMWLVVLVQLVAIGLSQPGRLRGEDLLQERRKMRQYEEEIEMSGTAGPQPGYDPSGHGTGPVFGFHPGVFGGREHRSGFGLTAMAPPSHWHQPPPSYGCPPMHQGFGLGSGGPGPW